MSPVSLRVPIAKGLKLAKVHRVTKSDPTFSPSQHAEAKHTLSRQYFAFVTAARKDALATSGAPKVETATSAVETRQRDKDARGAAKGAMLTDASLPPKAAETIDKTVTSWLARLPASDSPLLLLEGGGGERRLALAGRRLETRYVPVHELVGLGDRLLGGRCRPCRLEKPFGHST